MGDFGNGGQVILDESTFAAIKDDSQALGAVEASGLNHRKLSSGRSTWNRLLRLFGCVGYVAACSNAAVGVLPSNMLYAGRSLRALYHLIDSL